MISEWVTPKNIPVGLNILRENVVFNSERSTPPLSAMPIILPHFTYKLRPINFNIGCIWQELNISNKDAYVTYCLGEALSSSKCKPVHLLFLNFSLGKTADYEAQQLLIGKAVSSPCRTQHGCSGNPGATCGKLGEVRLSRS